MPQLIKISNVYQAASQEVIVVANPVGHHMNNERGAIVVLAALVLFATFVMLGMAIDTSTINNVETEKMVSAESVALGSLKEYLSFDPTPSPSPSATPLSDAAIHAAKLVKAKVRAEEIGGLNISTIQGMAQLNPGELASGVAGSIRSGRWWIRPVVGACTIGGCPCSGPLPCFQACSDATGCPNPDGTTTRPFASAMEVTLKTRPSGFAGGPIQSFIGNLVGRPVYNVSATVVGGSSATSTILPKRTVVLFSLGRAMASENFRPFEKVGSSGKEYAYKLNLACPFGTTNPFPASSTGGIGGFGYYPAEFETNYNAQTSTEKAKYKCYTTPVGESFLVNMQDDPEPLATALIALRGTLQTFQNDGNAADRLTVMAYDRGTTSNRKWADLTKSSAELATLINMTALDNAGRLLRAQQGFFPRGELEDLPRALEDAFNQLKSDPAYESSDNEVLLITNGISSCEKASCGTPPCTNLNCFSPYVKNSEPALIKSKAYLTHAWSLQEAVFYWTVQKYEPERFKIYPMLVGRETLPHTTAAKSITNSTRCMDETEKRQRNYLNVNFDSPVTDEANFLKYADGSSTSYSLPNYYFYSMARYAKSYFTPVRRPCPVPAGPFAAFSTSNYQAVLNSKCNSMAGGNPNYISDATTSPSYFLNDVDLRGQGVMDAQGRILCDPTRTAATPAATAIIADIQNFTRNTLYTKRALMLVR